MHTPHPDKNNYVSKVLTKDYKGEEPKPDGSWCEWSISCLGLTIPALVVVGGGGM